MKLRVGSDFVFASYRKEMRQHACSMIAFVFLSVFFVLAGVSFLSKNILTQSGDIAPFFVGLSSQVLFVAPLLTMRTFAEERKMKTEQLLLTLPVSEGSIVLGKFAACLSCYLLGLFLTGIYPLILSLLGSTQLLVIAGNYVGLVLLGGTFVAIGMFVSSFTENQMVSAIVSYSLFALLWIVGIVYDYVKPSVWKEMLRCFSLQYHFQTFTIGILDLRDVVYYLTVIALFLFLTTYGLKYKRLYH